MGHILVWKLFVSGPLALAFIAAYFLRPSKRNLLLMISGLIYCIADILINIHIALGIGVFAAGHIIMIFNLCKENRPTVKELIPIGIVSALFLAAALIVPGFIPNPNVRKLVEPLIVPVIIYAVIVVAAAVFSKKDSSWTFAGMLVFLASDIFLAVNTVVNATRPVRIAMLVIYYISIALLIISMLVCKNTAGTSSRK